MRLLPHHSGLGLSSLGYLALKGFSLTHPLCRAVSVSSTTLPPGVAMPNFPYCYRFPDNTLYES